MKSYIIKRGLLTVTEDREIVNPSQALNEGLAKVLGVDTTQRRFCEAYAKDNGYTSVFALLQAENGVDTKDIIERRDIGFLDGGDILSVKEWVERHDGNYANLVVDCPNIKNRLILPKKSLLVLRYEFGGCNISGFSEETLFKIITPNGIIGELTDKSHLVRE